MIRIVLLVLVLSAPALAQPSPDDRSTWDQTARGVTLLGGSASVTRAESNTSVFLMPRFGVFVVDGLAVGTSVRLSGGWSSTEVGDEGALTGRSLAVGLGPSVAYYLGDGPVRPYVQGDLSAVYSRSSSEGDLGEGGVFLPDVSRSSSFWTVGGELQAGLSVPVARNVALRGQAFVQTLDLTRRGAYYGLSAGFTTFLY